MNNQYGNNVFITGATSGIGFATAKMLAEAGFCVYGASRHGGEDIITKNGFVKMMKIDVTDEESISNCIRNVIAAAGSIDILINAAGNGVCGAVDESEFEAAFSQFNVNYFGTLRVINEVSPLMRKRGKGLIINIGSVGGIYSIPFQSLYSSSKMAVEAMTECMRIELKPFGVKATLIEPGDIKTGFTAARRYSKKAQNSEYGIEFKRSLAQMESDEQNGDSPDIIAKAILKVIGKKNPPVRTVVGGIYKFFVFLKRILPAITVEKIITCMYPKSNVLEKTTKR